MGPRANADRADPAATLVRFDATDDVPLAGLLFEPKHRTRAAVIWLHGTGGAAAIESRRTNPAASELIDRHLAYFAFNNRGAHVVRRAGSDLGGSGFERIRDCVHDIDGAVRELWRRGYRDLFLAGHSTGANKVAVYDHYKPRNRIKRYVLVAGGDDTGLFYEQLGLRRFRALVRKARQKSRTAAGKEIVSYDISDLPMSWRAIYDVANPDGDYNVFPFREAMQDLGLSRKPLFRHISAIRKPALFVYGERDEYCNGDVPGFVETLSQYAGASSEIVVVKGANHAFKGQERELAGLIADWVSG